MSSASDTPQTSSRPRLSKRPLAVTMGDPAGIGGEITLMAWSCRRKDALPAFFAIDDPDRLSLLAKNLGLSVPIRSISEPGEALEAFEDSLPVLPQPLASPSRPGQADPANGPSILDSIARAVSLTLQGLADAVVTNPISKAVLYQAGFRHPGHTEYLAALTGIAGDPVMMLAAPMLRVVPVTIHLPLADAVTSLTADKIVHCGRVTATALASDFGLAAPRLAVAGLNPHAGEGGNLGREEIEIIEPAVARLRDEGFAVGDPMAADSLFHPAARESYDAVLCMYHDQALIPLKTIAFDEGVNITLGLPIVRTSPDHGTAFDIAGKGVARPISLMAALRTAAEMAGHRARTASRLE